MLQVLAVLLVAAGLAMTAGAAGGIRWGVGFGGLVLAALTALLIIDVGDE